MPVAQARRSAWTAGAVALLRALTGRGYPDAAATPARDGVEAGSVGRARYGRRKYRQVANYYCRSPEGALPGRSDVGGCQVFLDAFMPAFTSEPRLLYSSEWGSGVRYQPAIEANHADFELFT